MIIDLREFLYRWRAVHVYSDHRTLDEVSDVVEELQTQIDYHEGLHEAAAGNLVEYVREGLSKPEPQGFPLDLSQFLESGHGTICSDPSWDATLRRGGPRAALLLRHH